MFRQEWGRLVATLIRVVGDWNVAEDSVQEAFEQALRNWPRDGVPLRPGAWLMTVARNRATDRLRRKATEADKLQIVGTDPTEVTERSVDLLDIPDDRLRLFFTCCHPALAFDARVALTLRSLAGLTTAEIGRAFLVPEPTIAKRLLRAKQKIRNAGIPYRVPLPALLPSRLAGVLAVVYLLFNEGYSASAGADVVRQDLCDEAISLSRALVQLMPAETEVSALLALLLIQSSRRRTRVDGGGEIVTLEAQNRSQWDHAAIAEARALLGEPAAGEIAGPYRLQARIASCHAAAASAAETDWPAIVELYERLVLVMPSPVVELNLAVAVAMARGPARGLERVEDLAPRLHGYYLLHATRADLLRRLGRSEEAGASYRQALKLVGTEPERRFLARRLSETGP